MEEARHDVALGMRCELYNAGLQERRDAWRLGRNRVSLRDENAAINVLRATTGEPPVPRRGKATCPRRAHERKRVCTRLHAPQKGSVRPLWHGARGNRDSRVVLRACETTLECRERLGELRCLERPIAPTNRDLHHDPRTYQLVHRLGRRRQRAADQLGGEGRSQDGRLRERVDKQSQRRVAPCGPDPLDPFRLERFQMLLEGECDSAGEAIVCFPARRGCAASHTPRALAVQVSRLAECVRRRPNRAPMRSLRWTATSPLPAHAASRKRPARQHRSAGIEARNLSSSARGRTCRLRDRALPQRERGPGILPRQHRSASLEARNLVLPRAEELAELRDRALPQRERGPGVLPRQHRSVGIEARNLSSSARGRACRTSRSSSSAA